MTKENWAALSWIVGQIFAFIVSVSVVGRYGFPAGAAFFCLMTVLIDIRAALGSRK